MTLQWNMMCRVVTVNSLMYSHINWENDALLITVTKHKGDQTGEGLGNEKHV